MEARIKVVIFDLDGTLTDSEDGIVASFRHVLAVVEIAAKDEQIHHLIGPPLVDGFAALGVPADQLDHAVETYRVYFSHTGLYQNRLYGGIKNMLGTLKQAGIILAVATSKRVEFAHRILDHFGMSAFFEVAAGASVDGSLLQKAALLQMLSHAWTSLTHLRLLWQATEVKT